MTRPLAFAIVDEVDSILIDEARVPFVISNPGHVRDGDSWDLAVQAVEGLTAEAGAGEGEDAAAAAARAARCDLLLDPRLKQAALTPRGMAAALRHLGERAAAAEGRAVVGPVRSAAGGWIEGGVRCRCGVHA